MKTVNRWKPQEPISLKKEKNEKKIKNTANYSDNQGVGMI